MDNELILFNTYSSDVDAYIDRGVLETNGVKTIITNEIMSSVYPLTLTELGAIKLWIRKDDADLAAEIFGFESKKD